MGASLGSDNASVILHSITGSYARSYEAVVLQGEARRGECRFLSMLVAELQQ